MKIILLFAVYLVGNECISQKKIDEYKASNGMTYHEGDTVKLGMGSGHNKSFVYVTVGGWAAAGGVNNGIGSAYAGLAVVIKKIMQTKFKGQTKTYFVVGGGNISNYNLQIEEAIAVCEITPCKALSTSTESNDKYDRLKKLKELLDQGVLTQEEYDKEKAKILEED